jgi:cyclophilin family peptidyl-prolyl cis-trans isomerase
MKKILFGLAILLVAISVSACSLNKTQPTGEESIASTSANQDENFNVNNNMIDPNKFADLTKEYSQAVIKTTLGNISVKFYATDSPFTVNNFMNLAQAGFYDGTKFHRVIKDFMIQGGDPLSKGTDISVYGTGGPNYRFKDEFNDHKLVLGSLAMANSGPNTNGSQFFIVTAEETPWLDGHHTNFGEVIKGLDIVQKIGQVETGANDRPVTEVFINSIELSK